MMTREDILRELELLPVWKLRAPLPEAVVDAAPANAVAEKAASKEDVAPEEAKAVDVEASLPEMRLIVSADSHWLFLLAPEHSGEAEVLLKNILKAISVNPNVDVVNANKQHLKQYAPQIIVVMGEVPAQSLLGVSETIDVLRGSQHQYESVPVVITYSPTHLLQNLADKAKVWEDLCAARLVVQAFIANKV